MSENKETFYPLKDKALYWRNAAAKGIIPVFAKSKEGRLIYSFMKKEMVMAIKEGCELCYVELDDTAFEVGVMR